MDYKLLYEYNERLKNISINQTVKAVEIMEKMQELLKDYPPKDKPDINQLLHAINESIELLPMYNKKWQNKTRYSKDDYQKFRSQKDIVSSRIDLIETLRLPQDGDM